MFCAGPESGAGPGRGGADGARRRGDDRHQGSGNGHAGYLDLWADQPTAQTCRADGDTFVSVGILAAGASTTLTVDGLLGGAARTKTLRAFVDSDCDTRETREGNNQKTAVYMVGP